MRIASLLLIVAGASGCSTYAYHRAALTPHTEPVLHAAGPSDAAGEVGVGLASVGHTLHVGEGNPDAAVEIPGVQLRADGRLHLGDTVALGVKYEHGLASTAEQEKPTQPPVDHGDVVGVGGQLDVSVKTQNPNLWIGFHLDLTVWRVPYVEWLTCVEFCGGSSYTIQSKGKEDVGAFGAGLTPSYRSGSLVWFGGLTARQHPTIREKGTEGIDLDSHVESGPFNLVASVGVEAALGAHARASMVLYQDLTEDPVRYGPSMAAMLILPLGERHRTPAPAPAGPPGRR